MPQHSSLRSCVLVALHVFVLASAAWLIVQSRYEDRLFEWFVEQKVAPGSSDEEKALALMHRTAVFLRPNAEMFGGRPRMSFKG